MFEEFVPDVMLCFETLIALSVSDPAQRSAKKDMQFVHVCHFFLHGFVNFRE